MVSKLILQNDEYTIRGLNTCSSYMEKTLTVKYIIPIKFWLIDYEYYII